MGLGQNPIYPVYSKDGVKTIVPKIDVLKIEYEIGVEVLLNRLTVKKLEELEQGRKRIKDIRLEVLILERIGFASEIFEKNIRNNYFKKSSFYQNPFFNQNKFYYNKGIPRSGKKTRGKYISMQVKARSRRKKIRKILEKI